MLYGFIRLLCSGLRTACSITFTNNGKHHLSRNLVRAISSRSVKWAGHVERVGDMIVGRTHVTDVRGGDVLNFIYILFI
jgi:hypothetical protein